MNSAILLIGSNIEPERNSRQAISLLQSMVRIERFSRPWVIPSFGSPGPDFINIAVQISTELSKEEIKQDVIGTIENQLGRVRQGNKNAPRTIDLDIILFNGELIDKDIWRRPYVVLPVADLAPELARPGDHLLLHEIADGLQASLPVRVMDGSLRD